MQIKLLLMLGKAAWTLCSCACNMLAVNVHMYDVDDARSQFRPNEINVYMRLRRIGTVIHTRLRYLKGYA